jgi:hypothetical protein
MDLAEKYYLLAVSLSSNREFKAKRYSWPPKRNKTGAITLILRTAIKYVQVHIS